MRVAPESPRGEDHTDLTEILQYFQINQIQLVSLLCAKKNKIKRTGFSGASERPKIARVTFARSIDRSFVSKSVVPVLSRGGRFDRFLVRGARRQTRL